MAEVIKQYDLRPNGRFGPRRFSISEFKYTYPSEEDREIERQVRTIVDRVRFEEDGDAVVAEFTEKFDGAELAARQFEIKRKEISAALAKTDADLLSAMKRARKNIEDFHKRTAPGSQRYKAAEGVTLEERVTPIERVGVYVPGGKAFYPSTVLMTVVPATVAGCEEIVVVSPPSYNGTIHPAILAAASLAGASRVFRIGGAQAVAALAYGTKTVPAVDKIVGPGNVYVTTAKRLVAQTVEIDKAAGPSEIVIIADASADPRWVAADMLSQAEHEEGAEHEENAVAILFTDSERLACTVIDELEKQLDALPRKRFAQQALKERGAIVMVSGLDQAVGASNMRAPEHLSLMVRKPRELLELVKNAGAIFLGPYSPVAVGDYIAGPSHVLPTGGTARFASALTVNDFLKRSTVIAYTKKRLAKEADDIVRLAEAEGFDGHAESIRLRLKR